MDKYELLKKEWSSSVQKLYQSPGMKVILSGDFEYSQYQEVLKQLYLYYRNLPQVHALATVYFHGSQRELIKDFYHYSITKIDEISMLANDLISLGTDIEKLKYSNPLPSTVAFSAFAFYQIHQNNPISYLGNLYHNENIFRKIGKEFILSFERKGVSRQDMSFLCEQAIVDRFLEARISKYFDQLIITNDDYDSALYAARASTYFFGQLIDQVMLASPNEMDWGQSYIEHDYVNELDEYQKTADFLN